MSGRLQALCPLCGSAAEYCSASHGNRKHFFCPRCTEFQISGRAERDVGTATQKRRDDLASAASRAEPGTVLVILVPNAKRQEGFVYQAFETDYVRRADLPPCE